jgi:hypothetical protein
MSEPDDYAMAVEYERQIAALGPDPSPEAIAAAMEWNGTHDWRAYRAAWRRTLEGVE